MITGLLLLIDPVWIEMIQYPNNNVLSKFFLSVQSREICEPFNGSKGIHSFYVTLTTVAKSINTKPYARWRHLEIYLNGSSSLITSNFYDHISILDYSFNITLGVKFLATDPNHKEDYIFPHILKYRIFKTLT